MFSDLRNAPISSLEYLGPSRDPDIVSEGSGFRSPPSRLWWRKSAAPSAPPASPAGGGIQMSSKIPERRRTPLATQLSATPPARQRYFEPVSSRAVLAMRRTTSS